VFNILFSYQLGKAY